MPLTNGSGSGSCYFRHWPSRCQQKQIFKHKFFCLILLNHFSKIKTQKESQNSRNQGFSNYFCMMIGRSGSGSIPLTSGSGSRSGRPKNMWIRWIRIRIGNTGSSLLVRDPIGNKHAFTGVRYMPIRIQHFKRVLIRILRLKMPHL
jgi:hypothetical protein